MIGFDSSGPLAGDCWQNRRPTPLIPANLPPAARCSRLTGIVVPIDVLGHVHGLKHSGIVYCYNVHIR